ncbi:MAG: T9SS type A sorting domain-containing protein [Paludibacter sp.]|nr:T9SS type A sorting domain-containing protein [Paludibacter sp.]
MKRKIVPLVISLLFSSLAIAQLSAPAATQALGWWNLQWPATGTIMQGEEFTVYAQVWKDGVTSTTGQGAGIQAWIGYSTTNTDPSTWTNWVVATYNGDSGNNDEYKANIATGLTPGTYYYASRFQDGEEAFVYGGTGTEGFWDNTSGVLTVTALPQINWANLQWPAKGLINPEESFDVYAQVYKSSVTEAAGQGTGISAWIGYSTENTDPSTWTNWIEASYNSDIGNNDEYKANIATGLTAGTYYFASRFKLGAADYVYGGFQSGFWDGTTNVNGELTITESPIFRGTGNWSAIERWSTGVVPSTSASVFIDGAATVASAAEVAGMTITTNNSVVVDAEQAFTVTGTLTNNGNLTLKSGATLLTNAVDGSGSTTVEQAYAAGRNWWYVSSPVAGATSNVFTPDAGSLNKVGKYVEDYLNDGNSETTIPYYSEPFAAASSTPLIAGTGYVAWLSSTDGGTYSYTGTLPNNGTYAIEATRTETTAAKRGFNLIGNPYPSYLNWNAAYTDELNPAQHLRNAIWFRTFNGTNMVFHTYGDGDAVPEASSPLIAPLQAFWVKASTDGSTGMITFKNTHRQHYTAGANPLKVIAADARPRLRLVVSNGTASDETLIVGKSYASNGLDSYDIEKMSNDNVTIPEICSLVENQEMVINSVKDMNDGNVVLLGFRTGTAGDFTLSVSQLENIDTRVMLVDQLTSTEMELTEGTNYSFTSEVINNSERFSIEFRAPGMTTAVDSREMQAAVFVNSDNRIVVQAAGMTTNDRINVYNLAGQQVASQMADGQLTVIDCALNNGVYLVKVNKIVQKVVVNK